MTLDAGTRLGPYEILSPLGAGGMGEVYKARDTRLGREVAVKLLPAEFASHQERLSRFEREARAASALSDPHIVTVLDVGSEGATPYLITELVDGTDLRALLGEPLPLKKALDFAEQIASGLAAAHEKGIVHRDLKPENVLVTRSGLAKIADFGLAKQAGTGDVPVSQLATSDGNETSAGVVMGTLRYMSPEQAKGQKVDYRSDQFSFGLILYEMLTGRHAFPHDTAAETMSAILREDPPPLSATNPGVPLPLQWIVERCLAKDSAERFASTRDLARDLAALRSHLSSAGSGAILAPPSRSAIPRAAGGRLRRHLFAALLAGLAVGAASTAALLRWGAAPPPPALRFEVRFPAGSSLARMPVPMSFSDDGGSLVYVLLLNGTRMLSVRRLDRFRDTPLPGTEGAEHPFFSPDGKWIGFFADGKLKKISINGGDPTSLCDVGELPGGGSWGSDGTIVFASSGTSALFQIPSTGGDPRPMTKLDGAQKEFGHRWPQILPGGDLVLFNISKGMTIDELSIALMSRKNGRTRVVLEKTAFARYVRPGFLIFNRAGQLLAAPFDLKTLAFRGPAVPIAGDVWKDHPFPGIFAASLSGALAYVPSGSEGPRSLVWVDRDGREEPIDAPALRYLFPCLSPDESRLTVTAEEGDSLRVWLLDLRRGTLSNFASGGFNHFGVWTPDGQRIVFSSTGAGAPNLLWKPADGTGEAEQLVKSAHHEDPGSISPDGRFLAYAEIDPKSLSDIWILPLTGPRSPRVFRQTAANELNPMFSPDGHWIAYTSDDSGRREVYAEPFPGPGARIQISTDGGSDVLWSPRGNEIYYWRGQQLMAVALQSGTDLNPGRPQTLFEGPYRQNDGFGWPDYAVTRDGQKFLLIKDTTSLNTLNVVLNWSSGLGKR